MAFMRFLKDEEVVELLLTRSGSKKMYDKWTSLRSENIMKIFPGRSFVVYKKNGRRIIVKAAYTVSKIAMDGSGLAIMFKELLTEKSLAVGCTPVMLEHDGQFVFFSVPVRAKVERTFRTDTRLKYNGAVHESMTTGMVIKQEVNPYNNEQDDKLMVIDYQEFIAKYGKEIAGMEDSL